MSENDVMKSELILKDPIAVASNKLYKKMANNGLKTTAIIPEPSNSSFFTQKYSIFGFEMSLYFILILIVVLLALFYYMGNYFEWFGKSQDNTNNKSNVTLPEIQTKPILVEPDIEEDEEEHETCELKKK